MVHTIAHAATLEPPVKRTWAVDKFLRDLYDSLHRNKWTNEWVNDDKNWQCLLLSQILFSFVSGLITPSGLSSIPAGLETPDIELRKRKEIEDAMEGGGDTPSLYTVLQEKRSAVGGAVMGSAHVYDLAAVSTVF